MQTSIRPCLAALAVTATSCAAASELSFHAGGVRAGSDLGKSYSWALEYRRPLGGNLAASYSWFNEGHPDSHHRDGQAVQIWWQSAVRRRWPAFELGVGPYYSYDTVRADNRQGYANVHDWGVLASAGVNWRLDGPWFASLRLNRVQVPGQHHSTALLAGVGYRDVRAQAEPINSSAGNMSSRSLSWEVDLMVGRSIRNSFQSESARGAGVALRMRAGEHAVLSVSYIDEGSQAVERRRGIAAQAWLEDHLTNRFSVGVGVGPYFLAERTRRPDGSRSSSTLGMVSVTAAYAVSERWTGRLIWNRAATRNDSDSDIVMLALGYRF